MKPACLLLAVWLLPIGSSAEDGGSAGAGKRVLAGTYTSAFNDRPNRVRATFLSTGEQDRWKVRFDFSFNNTRRTWNGTAAGSFEAGTLSGLVRDEDNNRAFTFALERRKNRFEGIHSEVIGGRERKTGTITMKGG